MAGRPDPGGRGGPRSPRRPDEDDASADASRGARGEPGEARRRTLAALPTRGEAGESRRRRASQLASTGEREESRTRDGWIGAPSPVGMDGLGIFFLPAGGPNQNKRWIQFGWLRSTEFYTVTWLHNVTEAESDYEYLN
uniref:Uncharacterized protein n=1 Tax=Oryza meridionalis TaxID=40149 RepID=A0A0E0CAZ1_9ORYZ